MEIKIKPFETKDKMPIKSVRYLVFDNDRKRWDIAHYYHVNKVFFYDSDWETISHWAKLPSKPKV